MAIEDTFQMQVKLDQLKKRPCEIIFCEPAAEFPALADLSQQLGLVFSEPIKGKFVASWPGDVIEVSGQMYSTIVMPCSRCLCDVDWKLNLDVLLCYSPLGPDKSSGLGEEKELSGDDVDIIPLTGDDLNILPELEQEIIMAIPQHILCKKDCAGLCPVCGSDQNKHECQCERPVFHGGFAALKNIKIDK